METSQATLHIFKEKIIEIEENTINIDVKQELDEEIHSMNLINDLIGETNGTSPIKHEVKVDLNTYIAFEKCNVPIKQESDIIDIENKFCYLNRKWRRRTKLRGCSLNGKPINRRDNINGIIICSVCGNLYTNKVEYYYHCSVHHSLRKKTFCKTGIDRRHMGNLTNINEDVKEVLVETKNSAQFNSIYNIDKPYSRKIVKNAQLCHYKKQFKCAICLKSFSKKKYLNKHILCHTGEKQFKCDICSKCFLRKNNLCIHLLCHTSEKPFKCDICLKSFSQKSYLNKHLHCHTGEKQFKCNICSKYFLRKDHLCRHLLSHTSEKPFKCDICLKSFSQKSYLNKHLHCHTGEKQFKCDICSKYFRRKNSLDRHLLSHTGEKPFKCDICLKYFSQKTYLNTHIKSHTGEKKFKCDICLKFFLRKNYLDRHLLCHSEDKPFKCDICLKSFSRKSYLTKHLHCHTSEKLLKCEFA